MSRLADFILDHPRSILGILFVLIVSALPPALQIRTDFNLENFFPREDPTIEDYQRLEEEFGRDDNVIMVGFKTDSLFSKPVLSDLRAIVDAAEKIEHVEKVRSLWSATQITGKGGRLTFDPYLSDTKAAATPYPYDSLKSQLVSDPFARGLLINREGNATAFYLEIESGQNNFSARDAIINRLKEILRPYRADYDFKVSGIPYYRNQYVHYLNDEIVFYITLSSVLIMLLLWGLYRSATGVIIPMLTVWVTILFTLAVMHLTGGYFEVMTSTIAPILLCVGVADSIHMLSKFDDARLQGWGRRDAIREMLMTLGSATFLTSITTAIGFGTLVTSNIVPMNRFGIYTAAGVLIAFVVTILFVPSALKLLGVNRIFRDKSAGISDYFDRTLDMLSTFNRSHYREITILFFMVTLALGSGAFLLKVNGKVFDELGEDTGPIRDARFFSRELSPPFPMEFIINTGRDNGITDPEFLQKLEDFTSYLRTFPEIERVTSFNTLLKEVHKAMAHGKASRNPLPDNEQLAAQYLLLLEVSDTEFLNRIADFSYRKVRVAARVQDAGSYRISRIQDSLQHYLSENFPDAKVTITGTTILSADLNSKIVASLFKSILLAFLLISVIMALLFRNIRMVFLSLIPNLLPLVTVAGIMGFTGIDIKSSTAVIFTIAFGIAVDDSIHYLARLRVEIKRGRSLFDALQLTTRKTGKAIIVTSLILLAGFGTLLTSVFTSTVYMGLLVCLTVIFALLADLLLLPSLFYWMRPDFSFSTEEVEPGPRSGRESRLEEP